jgi:outer membrane protein assembly factor BamB
MIATTRLVLSLLLSAVFLQPVPAAEKTESKQENWPAWRGPRGDGTSLETGIPLHWSDTENIRWKTHLPGRGYSSPVVWDDRIFVTWCVEEEKRRVLACLDRRDGKILWEKTILVAPLEQKHRLNSFASATPATDGKHVWATFLDKPEMIVACFTVDGKEVWRKSPGKLLSRHGFCSSPILYKDTVILNGDQDAQGYLVALEKTTGKERWRVDRPNRTRSYCTPVIVEAGGRIQLVMSGSKCVNAYDPDTGKQLWIIDGPTEQYVASLVYTDGLFFLTTGFPEYHLMGIRPDGSGNITGSEHIAWHHRKLPAREASYVPSPIAHGKYFYVVSDQGYVSCFEAKTGKKLWMHRLGRHHSASPVSVGGHLLFPADEGDTYVLEAGPEFKVVAKNGLSGQIYSSPAIAQGCLFIRTTENLYCVAAPDVEKK